MKSNDSINKFIEVKTISDSSKARVFLTNNEWQTA
jgi:hypothetical protein